MSGGRWGRIVLVLLALVGVVALVRKLRGPTAPQFSNHPSVDGGPGRADPVLVTLPAEPEPEPEPGAGADGEAEPAWVAPVDGACPDGYPIKAKVASGIFHQPGGLAYDRTKPDRCYLDAAAAEKDGFRAAKR